MIDRVIRMLHPNTIKTCICGSEYDRPVRDAEAVTE